MPRLWIDTIINPAVASGGTLLQSLMTGVSAAETRLSQMTLLRTIIGLDISHTVHDSGEGSQLADVGIAVASQEAFLLGSVSDPGTSGEHPTRGWVWRSRYRIWGFAADQPTIFTRRIDLDIRAMRKLENGESFMRMDNAPSEGVAGSISFTGIIRQLWLVS